MIDIETMASGGKTNDTDLFKAKNLLTTQIESLYFLPKFGIDLDMFFSQDYNIQFNSFKSYIADKIAQNGINIAENPDVDFTDFVKTITINIGKSGVV